MHWVSHQSFQLNELIDSIFCASELFQLKLLFLLG